MEKEKYNVPTHIKTTKSMSEKMEFLKKEEGINWSSKIRKYLESEIIRIESERKEVK